MADPLYDLLAPYFDAQDAPARPVPSPSDPTTHAYLNRLATLSLSSLSSSEPQSLAYSSASTVRSLQALSKRSHKSIIASSASLGSLSSSLPELARHAARLQDALPELESASAHFEETYSRSSENAILDRRRKAMLLARNVDRVADVLELPTLLSSAISSSGAAAQGAGNAAASGLSNANYASALDLHAHIKRLHALYPNVGLVTEISTQAEQEMKGMATNLITSLHSQGIKLAGAMRTIGWLRRIAPELDQVWNYNQKSTSIGGNEGALGALFLVCRLANLLTTLEALDPLRELADQEAARRSDGEKAKDNWAGGQQTERYLKRYIEIFREQSFAIISMYKSIFPSALPAPGSAGDDNTELGQGLKSPTRTGGEDDTLQPLPSALATFPQHLIELLSETLRKYLPNVHDRASRDSLLTQVLYCAGSLGRLGGDFGMLLALLEDGSDESEDEDNEEEWVEVMKKHRIQASRLELLASGVGAGRTASASG
ncbi:dor1-like family protein [Diplodia corticola]|uniref:Conserved oligomeric Golgi complex subunit 8 n=1 Tax=Diplodia corticola TaxID=236234 RepID=A0A1J9S4D4_9PEZI|nr:dor1-like family protein [Diplodia corticola]OJD34836.1 dor1-like family protein [Diplodia corticola]